MSTITNIKKAITEIKKITDQPHYKKLDDELNYLINQSIAITVEEYKSLLRLTRLYISTILYVVNEFYKLSGDESVFKDKIDSLSTNETFEYNIKPANGSIQKKTVNYSYFDTFSFDIILTTLNAVENKQSINNSQFFLPLSPSDSNEIADKITVNLTTIIQERVNINRYLESIKTNASKLKVPPTPSTTPTSVATTSSKDVDDYIKEFEENIYRPFKDVNKELEENENKTSTITTLKQNANNVPFLTEQIQVHEKHINLVEKYKNDILNFNITPRYTKEDIDETLAGLNKDIKILKELLNITKGVTQDSKQTPPASPTVETSPTTPTTPTKPDEKKPEVPLTPEQWGIKFTAGKSFYMDLLPARQSTIPVQGGRDVPNAMPGLNYKLVTQVGKQPIPGFSPVYQNLGVKGMQVTIVGAFTGADGDNTRGTDTPIPKDPNDKTPTWINPKGSPSTSDNPGRGGKLPELSAYNSYTEFVQLCHQGKHMEVEINLFQVYKENIASKIGQDIKLQSTNGNPKFNGIVRSLDVFHATKERTWYTLIMDVTDFGMASKDPIDLNNELDEAVKKAQAELEAAQQAGAQQNNDAQVVEPNADNDPSRIEALNTAASIIDKINQIKDPKVKLKQQLCFDNMMAYLRYIQDSRLYYFKDYISGKPSEGVTSFITGFVGGILRTAFDDITFRPKGNILWVRARVFCRVASFTGVVLGCKEEIYWKINFEATDNKYITRYIRVLNGTNFTAFGNIGNIKPSSLPQIIKPLEDECEGDPSKFDGDIQGLIGWNGNTFKDFVGKIGGCAAAGAVLSIPTTITGAATGSVGGPAGTVVGALSGFGVTFVPVVTACGFDVVGEAWQATQEFNKDTDSAKDYFVSYFFMNLLLGGAIKGTSFIKGKITKQGSSVKGGSSNSPLPNSTINTADDLLAKLKRLPDKNVLVGERIVVKDGGSSIDITVTKILERGNNTFVVGNNGKVYLLDRIEDVSDSVFISSTAPSPTPQPPVTPSSNVDNLINNSRLFSSDLKNYLLGLPENQKLIAFKALNEVDSMNNNQILRIELKDKSVVEFTTQPTTGGSGSISGGPDIINVADIESSSLINKPVNPTTPQTPPQQPSSPPQNIPDNQSSPTQQPSSGGGGSQGSTVPTPVGLTGKALDNYNKLLPLERKQLPFFSKKPMITMNTTNSSIIVGNDANIYFTLKDIRGGEFIIKRVKYLSVDINVVAIELATPIKYINDTPLQKKINTIVIPLDSFSIQ